MSSHEYSESLENSNEDIAIQANLTFSAHLDKDITVRERVTNYYDILNNADQPKIDELSNESYPIYLNDKAVQTEPKTLMLEKCTQTKSIAEILNEHVRTAPEPMDISVTYTPISPRIDETEKSLGKTKNLKRKRRPKKFFKRRERKICYNSDRVYDMGTAPRLLIVKEDLSEYNAQEILELRDILDKAVVTQSHPSFIPKFSEGYVVIYQTACEIICLTMNTLDWLMNIKLDPLNGIGLKVIGAEDYPVVTIVIEIPGVHRNIIDVKNTIFEQNRGFGLRFQTWFIYNFEKHFYGMSISFKINRDDAKILRNFRDSYISYGSRFVPFHLC